MPKLDLKLIRPIAGSMASMFALGASGASMVILDSWQAILALFLVSGASAAGFGWWWHSMVLEQREREEMEQTPEEPRYAMPQDIAALLDQHLQCVNAFGDAARMSLDVDSRLREAMQDLASYHTRIEDELDQLRTEAEKVQEIQRVAGRAPRLAPKTTPDDYGVRRKPHDQVPEFLVKSGAASGTGSAADSWPEPAGQPAE